MSGRVLVIAGSDSGGGAGIQADIKTITCMGAFAATAVTALTAQNTLGVEGVHGVPPAFIRHQIRVVLDDIGADCIKTGMLHDTDTVLAVVAELEQRGAGIPLVVDPVMIAQSGARLLDQGALSVLLERLLPMAALVTPNLPEAETLLQVPIPSEESMPEAARELERRIRAPVLLKGGHLPGDELVDVLCCGGELHHFRHRRIASRHTHGSGCSLASAISAGLSRGDPLPTAVERGRRYLLEAIRTAPGLGSGGGPMNHGWTVDRSLLEGREG